MPTTYTVGSRSLFVTATAWVFIVLAALASVSAVVQNAAVASLMPGLPALAERGQLPLVTGLLIGYLPWVVGTGLVMSLATLATAIGLLLRLDWARRTFIGLLVVAIVANLLGLWLQHEVVQSVVDSTLSRARIPPQALGRVRRLRHRHARDGGGDDARRLRAAGLDHPPPHVRRRAPGIRLKRAPAVWRCRCGQPLSAACRPGSTSARLRARSG